MRRVEMYEVQGKDTRVTITSERISIKVGQQDQELRIDWDTLLYEVLRATATIPLDTRPLRGRLYETGSLTLKATTKKQGKTRRIPYFTYSALDNTATWLEA